MTVISAANTTVVLLAAGHGKRMLPLTQHTPKPLLKVGESALIEHHLRRLQQRGFKQVVINLAYLGEKIRTQLGNGEQFGLSIDYSDESQSGALETAGGLKHALPLIKSDPFIVINADIWTDFNFDGLLTPPLRNNSQGRLVMVNNPAHNPNGDFAVNEAYLSVDAQEKYTFSGIALYQQRLFSQLSDGKQALAPIFKQLIQQQSLEGIIYSGIWKDIGTPERLAEINALYSSQNKKP